MFYQYVVKYEGFYIVKCVIALFGEHYRIMRIHLFYFIYNFVFCCCLCQMYGGKNLDTQSDEVYSLNE